MANFLKISSGAVQRRQINMRHIILDGKGLSVQDVTQKDGLPAKSGDRNPLIAEGQQQMISWKVFHRYKEDVASLRNGLQGLPDFMPGLGFSQMGASWSPMKLVCNFMTISLVSWLNIGVPLITVSL